MLSNKDQKFIKSLKVKKYRTREKSFLVEGSKNVRELMNSGFKIEIIVGTEAFFSLNLKTLSCRNEIVDSKLLADLGTYKTNEDAIAVASIRDFELNDLVFDDHLFVLDGVSDPGNVGTIIRTLDWFGFNQIVCSLDCADFYSPKVINSTMGSFTRVKVISCDLADFYQTNKLDVYAADMDGSTIHGRQFEDPSVFVMGSESHGISKISVGAAKSTLSIPNYGKAESLNVGVAAGIIASQLRMF